MSLFLNFLKNGGKIRGNVKVPNSPILQCFDFHATPKLGGFMPIFGLFAKILCLDSKKSPKSYFSGTKRKNIF